MKIGDKIKHLLDFNRVSQVELSRYTGISEQIISYYVRNRRTPRLSAIVKIADFFNVSVDYLVDEEQELPKRTNSRSSSVLNSTSRVSSAIQEAYEKESVMLKVSSMYRNDKLGQVGYYVFNKSFLGLNGFSGDVNDLILLINDEDKSFNVKNTTLGHGDYLLVEKKIVSVYDQVVCVGDGCDVGECVRLDKQGVTIESYSTKNNVTLTNEQLESTYVVRSVITVSHFKSN